MLSPPWTVCKQLVRLSEGADSLQELVGCFRDLHTLGDDAEVRANSLKTCDLVSTRGVCARICRAVAVHHRSAVA